MCGLSERDRRILTAVTATRHPLDQTVTSPMRCAYAPRAPRSYCSEVSVSSMIRSETSRMLIRWSIAVRWIHLNACGSVMP